MVNMLAGSVESKRLEIKSYFNETFTQYESLFDTLVCDDAFYDRPCSLRHPLIFYFGHTATFFTNKLVLAKLLPNRINAKIESMCAIGVDEMSWDDLNDAHYDWPSVQEVREYRDQVRAAVNHLIDTVEFTLPIDWQSPLWPVMMGIEHERIHLETSSVLIRQLDFDRVQPSDAFPVFTQSGEAPANELVNVPAGEVRIDHADPAPFYGWDNEYGQHSVEVESFKASKYLVSNQEYLEFVEAGGYESSEFWTEEGNRWREFTPDKHPTFWVKRDDGWYLRCMTDIIPMPWDWPAEVNALEAEAFCAWKAQQTGLPIRLPSEDEYLRLRDYSKALDLADKSNQNLQIAASSVPVTHFESNGFFDVIGNVWQWTATPIYPFDGFKVHPLYDDFTMPTFDNKHNLIKGSSWISTGNEINGSSRYAFRRHFFQHAGFRYIESDAKVKTQFTTYETDPHVAKACEFHYGAMPGDQKSFAENYAKYALEASKTHLNTQDLSNLNCLEVGCSVGRGSLELAKEFGRVTGLDFSARFINAGVQMQTEGHVLYEIPAEAEIMDYKEATLAELGLEETSARCEFLQQDPTNLKPHFTGYDVVVSVNAIERMIEPQKFLSMIHERMNEGGIFVLGSTYQWDNDVTPRKNWIGGYKDSTSGENVTTLEGLHAILCEHFECVAEPTDITFVEKQNHRLAMQGVSEVTVWKLMSK